MKLKSIYWYFFNREKYYNYIIYKWLIRAKKTYIDELFFGMCASLSNTAPSCFTWINICLVNPNIIELIIPEYYPEYFNTKEIKDDTHNAGYWWDIKDRESRIKAFNKLINEYKAKLK